MTTDDYLSGVRREFRLGTLAHIGIDPGADGALVAFTSLVLGNIQIVFNTMVIQHKRLLSGGWTAQDAEVAVKIATAAPFNDSVPESADVDSAYRWYVERVQPWIAGVSNYDCDIYLESVGAMPHDGRGSLWKFAEGTGRAIGSFSNRFISDIHRPTPRKWQKFARETAGVQTEDKWKKSDSSELLAHWNPQLHERLLSDCFGRRRMPSGVADAAWLALYGVHDRDQRNVERDIMFAVEPGEHMSRGTGVKKMWGDVYVAMARCEYEMNDDNLAFLVEALDSVGKRDYVKQTEEYCSTRFIIHKTAQGSGTCLSDGPVKRALYMESIGYKPIKLGQ